MGKFSFRYMVIRTADVFLYVLYDVAVRPSALVGSKPFERLRRAALPEPPHPAVELR